jgi:pimeloyl-ACP methyl ester carboxylesterase
MGKQDYMFLPSVKKIVKHHSNAVLETIDNCGHVVNIDASIEFNRIVISFFEKEI